MSFDPNKPLESSPEDPLDIPETLYYPPATYYLRVPDPRGLTCGWLNMAFHHLTICTAVVVEFVSSHDEGGSKCWAFRYLWAKWSLVVSFAGPNERWELRRQDAGPRTVMQVHELYYLACQLRERESIERFQTTWSELQNLWWSRQSGEKSTPGVTPAQNTESAESEEKATIRMKLADAKSRGTWYRRHDPETVVMEGFLSGMVDVGKVCDLFDLDRTLCEPLLRACLSGFDRLLEGALTRRCRAIVMAHRAKRITDEQASELLGLDWPLTEQILRIGSICFRDSKWVNRPDKARLLKSIEAIESCKRMESRKKSGTSSEQDSQTGTAPTGDL